MFARFVCALLGFRARGLTGVVSTLSYHVYTSLVLLPHHLRQLPFSSPPPPEYAATSRVRLPPVRVGMQNHMTVLPPDHRTRPMRRGKRTPPLMTYPPTTGPQDMHRRRHRSQSRI